MVDWNIYAFILLASTFHDLYELSKMTCAKTILLQFVQTSDGRFCTFETY